MSNQQTHQDTGVHILQPPTWARPRGYSQGVSATGRMVFISGQIGWDEQCHFQSSDFVAQALQALENILAVLAEANGRPEHVVRLTWYVVDKHEYVRASRFLTLVRRELGE